MFPVQSAKKTKRDFFFLSVVAKAFVESIPSNIFPPEFSSANVTCAAFFESPQRNPLDKIEFTRTKGQASRMKK